MSRPITFQNDTAPYLSAENLNKMQDELNPFRNMLNIPDGTYTHNGVTYIVKDGIFTCSSGTPTSDVNIGINITPFTLKAGTYTMSNNSGNYPYIMLFSGDTKVVESEYANNGVKTFTIENETTINNIHLYFGLSTPPASVKPQIEEGTRKSNFTSWTGYVIGSGSNNNINWIKYSDGTINYWGITIAEANQNISSVELPYPFVDNYVVIASTRYQGGSNALQIIRTISTPNTNLKDKIIIFNVYSDGTSPDFSREIYFNAIGKWK